MNNKDKEAFEKWWHDRYDECVQFRDWQGCDLLHEGKDDNRDGWRAACEYKQKEIDELSFKTLKLSIENSKYFHLLGDGILQIDKIQAKNTNLIKKFNYALSIMKDNHWDAEESEIEYQVYKILENALNEKL